MESTRSFFRIRSDRTEVANPATVLQLLDRGEEIRFIGPTVIPNVELQEIDGIDTKFLPDQVRSDRSSESSHRSSTSRPWRGNPVHRSNCHPKRGTARDRWNRHEVSSGSGQIGPK